MHETGVNCHRVKLAALTEVPVNSQRAFTAHGYAVLVCHTSVGVFAIENRCTHQLAALEGGPMRGAHIFCPKHGARFDLRTGAPSGSLTKIPVRTFPVILDDGAIAVDLPA